MKKAIEFLDTVINKKTGMKNDFLSLEMPWNQGPGAITEFSEKLAQVMDSDIKTLKKIKEQLIIACKHPKNMRDKFDDTWYCMNCNQDL